MALPPLSRSEMARYSRHLLLPQISVRGQQKLKASSVLIVGLGGLGSPIAMYLAAAGVGKLGLVDYDRVEISNLQRQVIHDVNAEGELKANSAAKRLADLNPEIEVDSLPILFNSNNAHQVSEGYDIIVDGTDNIPTRYLLNDLAVLTKRLYVFGSIFRFEGQVSVFGATDGPCYRCLFPEPPPPGVIPSCSAAGVMGVLPGIIGSIQAAEVIKLITGAGSPLVGKLLLFDALEMSAETVHIRKRPGCPVCGEKPTVTDLIDYEDWCHTRILDQTSIPISEDDIEPKELAQLIKVNPQLTLLDVREDFERAISNLSDSIGIPLSDLEKRLTQIRKGQLVVVYCRNGIRSMEAVGILKKAGFAQVRNLRGGINAWAEQVDSRLSIY